MLTRSSLALAALVLCSFGATSSAKLVEPTPVVPFAPRATIGHYNGNLGINTPLWSTANGDLPAATVAAAPPAPTVFGPTVSVGANAKAVGGQNWGPTLNIGTCVTGVGAGIVFLRTTVINGPSTTIGVCTSEVLMSGTVLAQLTVPHNGSTLNVPPQPVPLAAVGSAWVSQVLVRGGTVAGAELSSAIYGVVDVQF